MPNVALRTAQEALDKRANLVVESRKILDASVGAGIEMNADQKSKYEEMKKDILRFGEESKMLQEQERLEAESKTRATEAALPNLRGAPAPHEAQHGDGAPIPEWLRSIRRFYSNARVGDTFRISEKKPLSAAECEARGLSVDSATGGGYLVQPQHLADLIRAKDDVVYVRRKARKIRLDKADEVDLPTLAGKPTSFVWGTEMSKPTRDTNMSYGQRRLKVKPARGLITATKKNLRLVDPPPEQTIRDEFKALFGNQEENAFFNGNGANEPFGMMVEAALGIPASRSIATGNTATLVKFDGLIKAKYSIKLQYRDGLEWFFHRDVISQVATEKDANGRYLWNNSVALGEPDTILHMPVNESELMPNTQTSGQLVGLLANLAEYMIADGLELEVETLREVFWETSEVGFLFSAELDANARDVNAFARVKQG